MASSLVGQGEGAKQWPCKRPRRRQDWVNSVSISERVQDGCIRLWSRLNVTVAADVLALETTNSHRVRFFDLESRSIISKPTAIPWWLKHYLGTRSSKHVDLKAKLPTFQIIRDALGEVKRKLDWHIYMEDRRTFQTIRQVSGIAGLRTWRVAVKRPCPISYAVSTEFIRTTLSKAQHAYERAVRWHSHTRSQQIDSVIFPQLKLP